MATSLTLRLVENRPLTNQEVDDNFSSLNDNKLELDGSNSMSGKLTTVISSSTRASILMTPGSADPSEPSPGDFWNNGGDFKFYDGTSVLTIATTSGDQTLTNKTLASPLISDGIYFEGTTEDEFETLLTVADPTADRTVSIIDADGDVVLVNSGTVVNDIEEIDSAADLTLDATGDIILDADGADVILKDGGTEFGRLTNTGSELVLKTGTTSQTALTLSSSGGDVSVAGDLTVGGNDIKASDGTTSLSLSTTSGDVVVAGDLTITGNDIKSSSATAMTMSGSSVQVLGDLTVTGNDIKSSTATAMTMSGADVTVAGDLTVSGNDIKSSTGTALTLSGTNVTVGGDLTVSGNDIKSSTGATAISLNGANVAIAGDLTVNGITTTVNSTTVTIDDPIFTLGGDTAPSSDDNKDRGIEFRWHNGSAAKVGFFGFDDNTGYWTFIPDASNSSEVFSGTKGTLDVASITGTASAWTTARTLSLTGDVTGSASIDGTGNVSISTTYNNDVVLGTDTSGNYVASVATGTGLTGGAAGSEGGTLTLSLSHLGIQNLTDPNDDRIIFWDDNTGAVGWLDIGSGLTISGTTISHADTSSQASSNTNTGNTFIQNITLDTYGHVTALSTGTATEGSIGTVTQVNTGTGLTGGPITSTGTISLSHLGIQSLTDPNADRILFWDDSSGATAWLSTGTGISISGTTISNSGVTSNAGGTAITVSGSTGAVTINHSDTSTLTGAYGGSGISSITVDGLGHVTAISTATYDNYGSWTARDGDTTTYTITSGDTLQFAEGTGIDVNFTADDVLTFTNTGVTSVAAGGGIGVSASTGGVTISHSDTSSQASVNNSGRTFIQDITLDTYGHVTGIVSATDSDTYTGTVTSVGVSAGSGLTGGGTITTSGTVTLNIGAGTGIDVAADAISVDVSDFMSNGSNNRVVTATGTDAMNAEANLTFDGSTLAVTGAITATGDITAFFSDERLKNFTGKIENAIEKVKQLNGYYFTPNELAKELGYTDERVQVGVSAQEVENVLPEVVVAAPVSDEYKTVQYERMIALLIEAVKEQQVEIEALKKIVSGDN